MWKLTIEDDEGKKTPLALARDSYTIGRAEENTIRLTERNVSRKHGALRREGSNWIFADVGSSNGSIVNGTRIQRDHVLTHGDLVQIGDYRLEFQHEDKIPAADGTDEVPVKSAVASDRLVVVVGPEPGQEFPLTVERVIVGRAEDADIILAHGSVSRVHAEIHSLGSGRYEIIDQGSFNGVRVNGSRLQRGLLEAGDFIELGDVRLRFVGRGQFYKPGPEAERLTDDGFGHATSEAPIGSAPVAAVITPAVPALELDEGDAAAALRRSRHPALWIGTGLLALAIGAGIVAARASKGGQPAAVSGPLAVIQSASAPDSALALLNEALKLAAAGSIDAAHAKLSAIPLESSVRELHDFKNLEAGWADALLTRATKEKDANVRRDLLKSVAQATTVDADRRKRAADAILALDNGTGTDIHELPSEKDRRAAREPTRPASAAAAAVATPVDTSAPPDRAVLAANPFDDPRPSSRTKAQGSKDSTAGAAGTSDPSTKASELALTGRAGEARARAELEPRVFGGQATVEEIKMLRAICRHMGDRACTDRASALLVQGK